MRADQMAELERSIGRIQETALALGLDPLPTHFELVPASIMYEFGAYGLPGRFHHWTGGKAYQHLKTRYDFGLMKIYELVINADPAQAFLLETNTLLANKFVIAHVFAHSDFFKNNAYFRATPRDMVERANLHAERLRQYEFAHGRREVEALLDAVLAVQDLVDPGPGPRRLSRPAPPGAGPAGGRGPLDDLFPAAGPEQEAAGRGEDGGVEEEYDLLRFLLEQAPSLEEWERDLVAMVREERLYFAPQMRTKIINEGWATYWHRRILREMDLSDGEYAEFARLNADIQSPHRAGVNPYLLGCRIFEEIERQWGEGSGRQRILETREVEDDISFLRNHLTREVVEDLDLYVYEHAGEEWRVTHKDWETVREVVIQSRVNGGLPVITVVGGDYRGNRELYLRHHIDGRELDLEYAEKTLALLQRLWRRRVHLETVLNGEQRVLTCAGDANVE